MRYGWLPMVGILMLGGCSKKDKETPADPPVAEPAPSPAPSPTPAPAPSPTPASVARPSRIDCTLLGWSGGAAGKGFKTVKTSIDAQDNGAKLVLNYAWKGGVMTLQQNPSNPNSYSGSWRQQGGSGGANLTFSEPYTRATGSWSNAGRPQQFTLTISPCS